MERRKNPGGSNPSSIARTWSEHTGRRPHSDLVRTYLVFGTVYAVQCQTVETGTEGNSNDLSYHQQRNIRSRKKLGTDQEKTGKYTGAGCFTIVAEADGVGASKRGLLKAYEKERNGWSSLDFVTRI